jgi:hypothetical protein
VYKQRKSRSCVYTWGRHPARRSKPVVIDPSFPHALSSKCCRSICICKMQIRGALFRLQRLLQASLHFAAAPPLNRILRGFRAFPIPTACGPTIAGSASQCASASPAPPAPPPRAHPPPPRRPPASLLHPPLRRPSAAPPACLLLCPRATSVPTLDPPSPSHLRLISSVPRVEVSCSAEELHDGGGPRRRVSCGRGSVPRLLRTAAQPLPRVHARRRDRPPPRLPRGDATLLRLDFRATTRPSSASTSARQGGAGGRGGAREDGGGSRSSTVLQRTPLGRRRRSIRQEREQGPSTRGSASSHFPREPTAGVRCAKPLEAAGALRLSP